MIIWSLLASKDQVETRKNSYELFGVDIMISSDYNPFLIEINSSPDMSYSTVIPQMVLFILVSSH